MTSNIQSKQRAELLLQLNHIDNTNFDFIANEINAYQRKYNKVYDNYCKHFRNAKQHHFLPITAFKHNKIIAGNPTPDLYFESSGTTTAINSKHYVSDVNLYLDNCARIFESFYGPIEEYCFLALLPHYLERQHSSLICMVEYFIKKSKNTESGFFLNNQAALYDRLLECKSNEIKTILFGVSFALIDFSENFPIHYPELIIMETGGMKGRREEITKEALHRLICSSFGTMHCHSEYGMTELFSQAYSKGDGLFYCGNTMKVIITEINDPLTPAPVCKAGLINIIDLANIDSCSFITTEDIGVVYEDGSFTILGRLDQSDLRGCNLLVSDL